MMPVNKIICGDNMEVMAEMPNDSIDTIITDPHYCEIARARVKEARAGQGALFK